jgi:release factor glutamine methyltransferase
LRVSPLAEVTDRLGSATEARWILEQAGDRWPELVERRLAGEPLQYVLGSWPFRHLELVIDRRVLIPRPETEQVVEVALAELGRLCRPRPRGDQGFGGGRVAVDLGTGSGAIALSLATEGRARCPGLEVWATDRSSRALAVAGENLARVARAGEVAAVHLEEGDWFGALPSALIGRIDLLVANPPYVPEAEMADLDPVVRDWEPREALAAGPGRSGAPGMAAIETIIEAAPGWLGPGGVMVIELGPSQAMAAAEVAGSVEFGRIRVERDLAGRDRTLVAGR